MGWRLTVLVVVWPFDDDGVHTTDTKLQYGNDVWVIPPSFVLSVTY